MLRKLFLNKVLLAIVAIVSIVFNIVLSFKLLARQLPISAKNYQTAQVTRVIDGDTFDTSSGVRIRLFEIDAPEYPTDCLGLDAKSRLENLVFGKTVSIQTIKKDNFGRSLAYVYLDKLLVNEILTEEGLAYFKKDRSVNERSLDLERAEEKAKKTSRGVWSSFCQTQKPDCLIKGNYREADNTRIYQLPDCYNYSKTTIRPGTSDRWFCSEKEATAAGFVKSKDCPYWKE